MKAIICYASVFITLVLAPVGLAQDRYDRRIWLVNDTRWTLERFYASNVHEPGWGPDLLGRDVLYGGERARIDLDDGTGYCLFDLKAVFEDGDEVTRGDYNACERNHWIITE